MQGPLPQTPQIILTENYLKMIASHNNIPIYRATVDNEDTGMVVVSLVDAPAIESDFMAFNKTQEPMRFSVQNEEQRMLLGPVMIPELPIYRETMDGMPYYIVYDAQTIHKMAEKYFAENRINNVDTNHSFELVEGVTLVQAFFKNVEKGINPVGFEDLPDDTLFFQFHVTSDEIWAGVKEGKWKGFSLAGTFGIEPVQMQNNKKSNTKEMSKLEKIRTALQNILAQFARISTDKALIEYDGDELEVGMAVHGIDEEGNIFDLENGEYAIEEGTIYVIEDGKVAEIREVEKKPEAEEPAEEPAPEAPQENMETAEETPQAEEEPEPEADPRDEKIANLEAEVARLEEENGALKERIAELEGKSAAEPATEEFEKVNKVEKTGNAKTDKLLRILNAK